MGMTDQQMLFRRIDEVLMLEPQPSEFLRSAAASHAVFMQQPFDMLHALISTPQSPKHHPEGSAWAHTLLTVDEAACAKTVSTAPHALMWAALLHDVGKPATTRLRKGRYTSYDHDKHGEGLARRFLSAFVNDSVFCETVAKLTRWHMQPLFVLNNLPFAHIAAMKNETNVWEVSLLSYCDRAGRLHADKKAEVENTRKFLTAIHAGDTDEINMFCEKIQRVIIHA